MSEPTPPLVTNEACPPGGAGGVPGSDLALEKPPGEEPRADASVDIYKAKQVNVSDTIIHYDGCSFGTEGGRPREMSPDQFEPWDPEQLANLQAEALFDPGEVDRLVESLCERHLLVISGEDEVGKGTLSLLVAAQAGRHRADTPRDVLYSHGLAPEVRVSLERLSDDERFAQKFIIFRDAFASRNEDLMRFARDLDSRKLSWLSRRLETAGIFVILTSDADRVPGPDALPRLKSFSVLHEVVGPGRAALLRDLHRRAELRWRACAQEGLREKVAEVLIHHAERVVDELRTVPRIVRFVEAYLLEVANSDLPLEHALSRVRNRADWLLSEMAEDPATWSFALALILAQPLPSPNGVPWHQFFQLWQAVTRHLRRELRLRHEPRSPKELVVDCTLLDRVRAEIRRASTPAADIIQFHDSLNPTLLWEDLLGPGRALLSSLVPLLTELAEKGDFCLRECTARALGRIGRLDPASILFPLIYAWSNPDRDFHHHVALGRLFQGMLESGEENGMLREECMRQLRHFALSRRGDKIWPGVVALREIGRIDLRLALRELVEILVRELEERLGSLSAEDREWLRTYEELRREVEKTRSGGREENRRVDEALEIVTPLLFTPGEQKVLAGAQYALVGLCFALSPTRVLTELHCLLRERGEGKLSPLVTLLLLRTNGIADILERNKTPLSLPVDEPGTPGRTVALSDFILMAVYEDEGGRHLANLLERVYIGAEEFPGLICRSFRSKLLALLKFWVGDSCPLPVPRETCVELLSELLASQNLELREVIFDFLQRDPDFTAEGSALANLALDALVRKPGTSRDLVGL
jgi:hypothetical protein